MYVQDSEAGTDDVVVKVGLKADALARRKAFVENSGAIVEDLKNRFRAHLRVSPKVEIHSVAEIQAINFPPKTRKPVKFIDLRKK
jgi:phenylacetate-CoA ligase